MTPQNIFAILLFAIFTCNKLKDLRKKSLNKEVTD